MDPGLAHIPTVLVTSDNSSLESSPDGYDDEVHHWDRRGGEEQQQHRGYQNGTVAPSDHANSTSLPRHQAHMLIPFLGPSSLTSVN